MEYVGTKGWKVLATYIIKSNRLDCHENDDETNRITTDYFDPISITLAPIESRILEAYKIKQYNNMY